MVRVCRALRVLCAAPDDGSLRALKGAAVSARWELVGGATTAEELVRQLDDHSPDVLVVDASLAGVTVDAVRTAAPRARVVSFGFLQGADGVADSLEAVRDAILGLPPVGGPVLR
jgi:DNA-binding NarL/FixJ family response regulator